MRTFTDFLSGKFFAKIGEKKEGRYYIDRGVA